MNENVIHAGNIFQATHFCHDHDCQSTDLSSPTRAIKYKRPNTFYIL